MTASRRLRRASKRRTSGCPGLVWSGAARGDPSDSAQNGPARRRGHSGLSGVTPPCARSRGRSCGETSLGRLLRPALELSHEGLERGIHDGADALLGGHLGIEIPLADLYENVEFPPEDPLYTAMLREQEAAYAIP